MTNPSISSQSPQLTPLLYTQEATQGVLLKIGEKALKITQLKGDMAESTGKLQRLGNFMGTSSLARELRKTQNELKEYTNMLTTLHNPTMVKQTTKQKPGATPNAEQLKQEIKSKNKELTKHQDVIAKSMDMHQAHAVSGDELEKARKNELPIYHYLKGLEAYQENTETKVDTNKYSSLMSKISTLHTQWESASIIDKISMKLGVTQRGKELRQERAKMYDEVSTEAVRHSAPRILDRLGKAIKDENQEAVKQAKSSLERMFNHATPAAQKLILKNIFSEKDHKLASSYLKIALQIPEMAKEIDTLFTKNHIQENSNFMKAFAEYESAPTKEKAKAINEQFIQPNDNELWFQENQRVPINIKDGQQVYESLKDQINKYEDNQEAVNQKLQECFNDIFKLARDQVSEDNYKLFN